MKIAGLEQVKPKELEAFPIAQRMRLGEYQAQVKPLISIPLSAPADGDIRFLVTKSKQFIAKDTLWAEVNPEQLDGEEKTLKLNTQKERLQLREELENVDQELARVEYMLNDPALRDLPYEDQIPVSTNLLNQIRGEQQLLKEKLALCGVVERLTFEQKMRRSRLTMPFDGELLIYFPVSSNRKEFRVAANTPVGLMRDVSQIYLHLVIRDPHIAGIPPEQLSVSFTQGGGVVFEGKFYDTQITERQNQDILVYRFSFSSPETKQLVSLIGANLTCNLWINSDQSLYVVPKVEIATLLEGRGSFAGWREGVHAVWPSAKLLYSGRSQLCIIPKSEAQ